MDASKESVARPKRGLAWVSMVVLAAFFMVTPAVSDAATTVIDSDYSSWDGVNDLVCDHTPGHGNADGLWRYGGGANTRVSTSGNPSWNGSQITPAIDRHKVCQSGILWDPCSSWVYEI